MLFQSNLKSLRILKWSSNCQVKCSKMFWPLKVRQLYWMGGGRRVEVQQKTILKNLFFSFQQIFDLCFHSIIRSIFASLFLSSLTLFLSFLNTHTHIHTHTYPKYSFYFLVHTDSLSLFLHYLLTHTRQMFLFRWQWACVCVCVWEREREKGREWEKNVNFSNSWPCHWFWWCSTKRFQKISLERCFFAYFKHLQLLIFSL